MLAAGRPTRPSPVAGGPLLEPSANSTCRLSFYESPPSDDIDLDSFETNGIARLHVLRRIDILRARGVTGEKLAAEIRKVDEQQFGGTGRANLATYNDQLSHHILRLAFCQTEELRRWFLQNECTLFKMRFEASKASDVNQFLKQNDLLMQYPPISTAEKMRLKSKILAVCTGTKPMEEQQYHAMDYYKVPFTEVIALVSRREVFLEVGYAYVSSNKILSIIEGKFRSSLAKSLNCAYQMKHLVISDTRISSIVSKLSKVAFRYGGSIGSAGGAESSGTIEIFSEFLKTLGHSDIKIKPCGVSKLFVSTGTKKPNACDKWCPIANRAHKSNTQKYTIYFDTMVMEQGCWDGVCQATNRHVYYQLKQGQDNTTRCVKVGWTPPPLDENAIANINAIASRKKLKSSH